jgi:hypothetical protein
MASVKNVFGALPPGYVPVPLLPGQERAPLRVCVVFRQQPDKVSGHFVIVRDTFDARVLLGAVVDAAGRVVRFVEVWIQTLEGLSAMGDSHRQLLTNRILDKRWARQADMAASAQAGAAIRTGWESTHPAPLLIDLSSHQLALLPAPGAAASAANSPWALCEDDAMLAKAGLPPYSSSLDRYLYQPQAGAEGPFVPVTAGSPTTPSTVPLDQIVDSSRYLPLNPGAGLLMIREYLPFRFDDFTELLEKGNLEPGPAEEIILASLTGASHADGSSRPAEGIDATRGEFGRFFLARHGRAATMVETFYLRLCAIAGAVQAVRHEIQYTERPVLNLCPESFRVTLSPSGPGLPFFWNSSVALVDSGDAIPLRIASTDIQYHIRDAAGKEAEKYPVYRPDVGDAGSQGQCTLRIRQVLSEARGTVIEATLTPRDRFHASRNDLLRIRVGVAAGRVDLYAQLQPEMALATGEWRVRSLSQALSEEVAAQLRAAEGVSMRNVEYEHIPLLSTPCDLYALAVLALSTLVGNPGTSLAVIVDETWSLARQAAADHKPDLPLVKRIAAIFERDARWLETLGPKLPSDEAMTARGALELLPPDLWWHALAWIVRMLPGAGPDSFSTDYGDAPPNAPHRVFEPVIDSLNNLLGRARSVLLVDWKYNREVSGVLRRFRAAMAPREGAAAAAAAAAAVERAPEKAPDKPSEKRVVAR